MAKKRRKIKPPKRGRGRPPKKKQSEYMRRKRERMEREEREKRETFAAQMRKAQTEPLERDRERAKWTKDLSWQSKPPPPEVIYMIFGTKPVRCRLTHMHNMPVYLPDIDELP